MTKKKAFTLVEILITIVVMAALVGIALPSFQRSVNRSEAIQVISYLRAIRASEKMYFGKWKEYNPAADAAAIKGLLGADPTGTQRYSFDVVTPTTTTFTARARKGGAPANCAAADTLCLDQSGTWTGASKYKPTAVET